MRTVRSLTFKQAEGKAVPCLVSTLLEDASDETQENLIRDCAGVMYGAGADSVCSGSHILGVLIECIFSNFLDCGNVVLVFSCGHLVSFVL